MLVLPANLEVQSDQVLLKIEPKLAGLWGGGMKDTQLKFFLIQAHEYCHAARLSGVTFLGEAARLFSWQGCGPRRLFFGFRLQLEGFAPFLGRCARVPRWSLLGKGSGDWAPQHAFRPRGLGARGAFHDTPVCDLPRVAVLSDALCGCRSVV